jgi:RHS repeat-associated protein
VHGNHLGVPQLLMNASGTAITPSGYALPGYPGQSQTLADLYYNRYRDYDSSTGRYIQADPIGLAGDVNPYGYALNNPLKYIDPTGEFGVLGAGFGAAEDILWQRYVEGKSWNCIDWGSVATSAAMGAIGIPPSLRRLTKFAKYARKADNVPSPRIKPGSSGGPTAGRRFSPSVKEAAKAENPAKTCVYCNREGTGTQVDHAIPKKDGGNATLDNAQMACPSCNSSKGAGEFPKYPPAGYDGPWPPAHWPPSRKPWYMPIRKADFIAIHLNPIWRSEANYIFRKTINANASRVEWEQLWGKKFDNGYIKVCCIPFFTFELSLGDIVKIDNDNMFVSVIEQSGLFNIRIYDQDNIVNALKKYIEFDVQLEVYSNSLGAIAGDKSTYFKLIEIFEKEGTTYELGNGWS